MTNKQAIDILKTQKSKLVDKALYKDETWTAQTASYIKDFFGAKSSEYFFITQFSFIYFAPPGMTNEGILLMLQNKITIASRFIDNCIETIQHKGLYKPTKTSFIQNLSNNAIWAIFSISIPGLLTIGYLFGQFTSDTKNYELRQEVKQLKDSLSIIHSLIITNPNTGKGNNKISNKVK